MEIMINIEKNIILRCNIRKIIDLNPTTSIIALYVNGKKTQLKKKFSR